jgi:protein-tyrosine phosphatase
MQSIAGNIYEKKFSHFGGLCSTNLQHLICADTSEVRILILILSLFVAMKILMVCLGNICRSPVAEGVLRERLKESGISHVHVDSAGTSGWHNGEHPDKRSTLNAKQNGVDISKQISRKFTVSDFENFDIIYVMDQSNYIYVTAMTSDRNHRSKVRLLLNEIKPHSNAAVPDPYYGGEDGFQRVFELIDQACRIIAARISENKL